MEAYVLDELVASVDQVVPGLGPLAGMLAVLAAELTGPDPAVKTLEAMEELTVVRGREMLCALLQYVLDARAAAEVRLPEVTGADGVTRTRAERDHGRIVVTTLGEVRVARIGYRAAAREVPALFPRDMELNLPLRGYSWRLQQLAVMFTRSCAYELAREFTRAATGVTIGKRQLQQITAEAAADAAGFYPALARQRERQEQEHERERQEQEPGQQEPVMPLGLSADGKGVAMRPESRRATAKAPGKRVRTFARRRGTGEKGHKRMAETGCIFDVEPVPRTPEQVMAPGPAGGKQAPRALDRWYTVDIAAGRDHTVSVIFDQAEQRDPGHARPWIALVDGDIHQIRLFRRQAAARGITITILVDFIHVLELSVV